MVPQDKGELRAPQAQRERQNCKENPSESSATLLEPQSVMESSSLLEAVFVPLNTSTVGIQPTPASTIPSLQEMEAPFPSPDHDLSTCPVTNAAPAKPLTNAAPSLLCPCVPFWLAQHLP